MFRHGVSLLGILALAVSPAGARPHFSSPGGSGYADPYPPSYYGYNLDDNHPGYYGGMNYREYYSFGRGYGLANFPGPLPSYPYFPLGRSYRPYVAPPVQPDDPLPTVPVPSDPVAHLEVQVPAEAEVWLEGVKTRQSGTTRVFVSPPLTSGVRYAYEIRARWTEDGHEIEQTENVIFGAGDRLKIHFPKTSEPEALPELIPFPRKGGSD